WALYKEVQDYYDKGMRVPDDITLLLCDDNWGNIRRLPPHNAPARKGGYGIYYHFDYVGGPRNYKWLNTNNIARVWEQMHLAWEYNARQIWIVNVGDLKPMEFPVSFFLDYAWAPEKIKAEDLPLYTKQWCREQFGDRHAAEIASVIDAYTQYNARCKPELLGPETFSMLPRDTTDNAPSEFEEVTDQYRRLMEKAEHIYNDLAPGSRDAYFELVLHPVKACSNLYQLYYAVALNRMLAKDSSSYANIWADKAKMYFIRDSLISAEYNSIAHGKWNHMMDQTHIGYTWWQQPPVNKMPALQRVPSDGNMEAEYHVTAARRAYYHRKEEIPASPGPYKTNRFISIDAAHYTRAIAGNHMQWKIIPGIGRTGDGLSCFPVTAPSSKPGGNAPHTEYQLNLNDSGAIHVDAYFSPTLNLFHEAEGLRYAISIDDEEPQIISINKDDNVLRTWEQWVSHNIIIKTTAHNTPVAGKHVLKYWMVDPGVVLQKLVIHSMPLPATYLGPPETRKYLRNSGQN
ncbi:MAG: glycosyl hydrolase 115 family protein, partial [Bacteroidetes bacterium]|nr:glycosyl hydrolase 115 family protein [Bacteroidota bacterium]